MLYILLPAYNEERDIRPLLERICGAMQQLNIPYYKVFVVNDGSTDGTVCEVLAMQAGMPLELLDHGVNKGLGQAMLTGLRYAASQMNDEDVLVSMDADNTHEPLLIGAMLEKIRQADIVIASRYETGGEEVGLSKIRSILSRGASTLLVIFFPIPGAKDYTCGYRAYRGELLKRAYQVYGDNLVAERGFTCMAEILIKLRAIGARVTEVPLVLRYDLKSGMSKMKVVRTILRYFVLIGENLKGIKR
jgi:dolichol-phosphate mannosyltransferase